MRIFSILLIVFSNFIQIPAQNIQGQLMGHAGQKLTLIGFDYYKDYPLHTTTVDQQGNFIITYPENYRGMAILETERNNRFILLLDGESIHLKGTHLNAFDNLQFTKGTQNQKFVAHAKAMIQEDKVYAAWRYLQKQYNNPYFSTQNNSKKHIDKEIRRIEGAHTKRQESLKKESYLSWYMPLRKLVNDMPKSIQNYSERIPLNIQQFRNIDFTNSNFKTSGIFRELIEGHYFLLENMGTSLGEVYKEMNLSTDYLIHTLKNNSSLLNAVAKELFVLFEKRSLFKAAAHLSSRLLEKTYCSCTIEESLQKRMHKYGVLKVGNTAPDIQLTTTKTLSDIKQNVLLVFGASTCATCQKEANELVTYDKQWKDSKTPLKIIYISLDTNQNIFNSAFKNVPWQSYCDFKGWESKAAKDYHINATPTYILLNKERKILLHPRSLAHVNAWIQGKL
ncbi:TlpA family protein disulfide reductase [Tenacibaculum agarivorans]|uniref:TlpA family protein disulfide reductase n=1 Tax=Tenacibaculum agarivorans TaxID=1908389 RepID=UPI00094BA443|nr:thioredoxin family protein [Tenacibaculum agarivorans]